MTQQVHLVTCRSAALDRDEAVALVAIEPLHVPCAILTFLVVDAAARLGGRGPRPHDCFGPARHGGRKPYGVQTCPGGRATDAEVIGSVGVQGR